MKFFKSKTFILIIVLILIGAGIYGAVSYKNNENNKQQLLVKVVDPFEYFDTVSERFFDDSFFKEINHSNNVKTFIVDIREEKDKYILEAQLPAISKEEIQLKYENNNFIISVERKKSLEENKDKYLKKESSYSSMARIFYIPNIKEQEIKAKMKDGILTVNLPKGNEKKTSQNIVIE